MARGLANEKVTEDNSGAGWMGDKRLARGSLEASSALTFVGKGRAGKWMIGVALQQGVVNNRLGLEKHVSIECAS